MSKRLLDDITKESVQKCEMIMVKMMLMKMMILIRVMHGIMYEQSLTHYLTLQFCRCHII